MMGGSHTTYGKVARADAVLLSAGSGPCPKCGWSQFGATLPREEPGEVERLLASIESKAMAMAGKYHSDLRCIAIAAEAHAIREAHANAEGR